MFNVEVRGLYYSFELYLSDIVRLNEKHCGNIARAINLAIFNIDNVTLIDIMEDIVNTAYIPHVGCKTYRFKYENPEVFQIIVNRIIGNPTFATNFVEGIIPSLTGYNEKGDNNMTSEQLKNIVNDTCRSGRYPRNQMYTQCCTPTPTKKFGFPPISRIITHNDRVVIVKFADGSFTKAVCSANDKFDIDVGITVCLLKKVLGGTNAYNNLIRKIHKQMDQQEAAKQAENEAKKAQRKKQAAIKAKRDKGREEASRSFRNDITDAVVQALKTYDKKNAKEDAK